MRYLLLPLVLALSACGDAGPAAGVFDDTRWRLTSVGVSPLPAPGNTTGGEAWTAGVLRLDAGTGRFDRCTRSPTAGTLISRFSDLTYTLVSDTLATVAYFDRPAALRDTMTVDGEQLTLRFTNQVIGQEGVDVLTFVPLPGEPPEACSLVP